MLIRALVVDDDLNGRRIISRVIKKSWACEITEAKDGLEALSIILKDQRKFDLVILDVRMPFIDGFEFLSIIRNKSEFASLPIIVCSGVKDTQEVKKIIRVHVDDYILKPIDKITLLKSIFKVLRKTEGKIQHGNFKA